MLTITRIIDYSKLKKNVKADTKDLFKQSEAKRLRERRAQARADGKCGSCCARRPPAGFKTCDFCRNKQVEAERRATEKRAARE